MIQKLLSLLLICLPFLGITQNKGIHFEEGLNWSQVKEKAVAENKYIFVDCYASWCRPCMEMDKYVYIDDSIGKLMNAKFISIKVQFDTTKHDAEHTKILYRLAREIEAKYKIIALPTFLFFTSDGEILHKDVGYKSKHEFFTLLKEALDEDKQLYTIVKKTRSTQVDFEKLPIIANRFRELKDNDIALAIARKYMQGYLNKLPDSVFCKKENLFFLQTYYKMIDTSDKFFKLLTYEPAKVDRIMSIPGYSDEWASRIICRVAIEPGIQEAETKASEPNWRKIKKRLIKVFSKDRISASMIIAKENYYFLNKDWDNYFKTWLLKWKKQVNIFPRYGWMGLNQIAWSICVHSNNKKQLRVALQWADLGISLTEKQEPSILDTKSQLLYKLGLKKQAIDIQSRILQIFIENLNTDKSEWVQKQMPHYIANIKKTISKMQKGETIIIYE